MRTTLAVVAACLAAARLPAQGGAGGAGGARGALHATLGASVAAARARSQLPTGTYAFAGTVVGGQGGLAVRRWLLDLSYRQGTLHPDSGNAASRDFVEGRALLGFRPRPWLALQAGPHARAYVIAGATQRWLFWEVRARAEGPFIGAAVSGYGELWRAVSASANVPEPLDRAQGGEAGMILRPARGPFDARVAYRIEHAVLGGGSRLETVDGVLVGITLARR